MTPMRAVRSHLTYANVAATLAVVLALSGTAYAAALAKNSVTSSTIKNGQVKSADLKNSGVKAVDVADQSLTGGDVADGSLKGADIDEASLARVPDAAALGGVAAAALRTVTFPITSAGMTGSGASAFTDEVDLSGSTDGTVSWTFLLPPDRRPGDSIFADLTYQEGTDAACSWFAATGGIVESEGGFANSAWVVPGNPSFSGPVSLPASTDDANYATFRFASTQYEPGDLVSFTLTRQPGNAADTCQTVRLRGIQFRY